MAEKRNSPVTEPAERVLVISRVFDAPRTLVFKGVHGAWARDELVGAESLDRLAEELAEA